MTTIEPHHLHARRVYEWHTSHPEDIRARPDWARRWIEHMVEIGYITEAERRSITGEAEQLPLFTGVEQ